MNMILLSFACGLALIYGVRFSLAGPSWTKSAIKTGSVVILAVLALVGGGPLALVLGLLFGAMGDFWLSRDGARSVLVGLVSFAFGHIAYSVLLWQFGAVAAVSIWTVLLGFFFCCDGALSLAVRGRASCPCFGLYCDHCDNGDLGAWLA